MFFIYKCLMFLCVLFCIYINFLISSGFLLNVKKPLAEMQFFLLIYFTNSFLNNVWDFLNFKQEFVLISLLLTWIYYGNVFNLIFFNLVKYLVGCYKYENEENTKKDDMYNTSTHIHPLTTYVFCFWKCTFFKKIWNIKSLPKTKILTKIYFDIYLVS